MGYIYVVSSLGVTGIRSNITTDIGAIVKRIREVTDTPVAVGFGIATPEPVSYTHLDVYKRQNNMRVAQEEIFGPVAVVIKFKDEADVIRMANESVYGLGGAVWTQDINRAMRVAKAVQTGRIWVNTYNAIPAGAPFGGYKQSGIGRETHKVMLDHYSQTKNIMINLSENTLGLYE